MMPPRLLVHLPEPEPPELVELPPRRPARGEEFPPAWTVADYQLERGDFEGEGSRCGAEIVVMTAGDYLSSTDADLDFMLHVNERESRIAIRSELGSTFACPTCGANDRLPRVRKFRAVDASTK